MSVLPVFATHARPRSSFRKDQRVTHHNDRMSYGSGTFIKDADGTLRAPSKGYVQFDRDPPGAPRLIWLDDLKAMQCATGPKTTVKVIEHQPVVA